MTRRKIKIGVSGTHSTGKSTFLNEIDSELTSSGIRTGRVSDLGRAAKEAGFPILMDHTFESTLWIITQGIANELKAALTAEVVLVDRPVPDALAYLQAALTYRKEKLPDSQYDLLQYVVLKYSSAYEVLLRTKLDPFRPLGLGKERDTNEVFRTLAAEKVERVFDSLGLPFLELTSSNSKEVGELVINSVHNALKGKSRT
jgi:hypothetical protein